MPFPGTSFSANGRNRRDLNKKLPQPGKSHRLPKVLSSPRPPRARAAGTGSVTIKSPPSTTRGLRSSKTAILRQRKRKTPQEATLKLPTAQVITRPTKTTLVPTKRIPPKTQLTRMLVRVILNERTNRLKKRRMM